MMLLTAHYDEVEAYEAPNLRCRDCIFCETELCRRVNYRSLDFYHRAFASATSSREWQYVCRDFQMAPYMVRERDEWPGFDSWQAIWVRQWLDGHLPKLMWFHVNGNSNVDYGVPYDTYVEGHHIQGNLLMATVRRFTFPLRRSSRGYRLFYEELTEGTPFGEGGEFSFFPRRPPSLFGKEEHPA